MSAMPKASAQSALLRLIEVGQRARQVLARPLIERGLLPGDEAILLALKARLGASERSLAETLETHPSDIALRVERLRLSGYVLRNPLGEPALAGLSLTEAGERLVTLIEHYWASVEEALVAPLSERDRKRFNRVLKQFGQQLRGA